MALLCIQPTGCTTQKSSSSTDAAAGDETGDDGTVDDNTVDDGETTGPVVRLGSLNGGGAFDQGSLVTSVPAGQQLAAGGTATVTATVVDTSGNLYTDPMEIAFSSSCVNAGTAEIDPTVMTINGSATAAYRADGCEGQDSITATTDNNGTTLVATCAIDVAGAAIGSIVFENSDPANIALKGTGGPGRKEDSTVSFIVVDETGNRAANETVEFELSTDIGGITMAPDNAQSDADGRVQVVVTSGNVPTSVRVSATVENTLISTVSDELVVSTGLPDQNSFSISTDCFNPEGWNYDGEVASITIRSADHFNNPVPDGTAIVFTTEGGAIEPSCMTTGGACSVTWTSQDPRPLNGRVTILATAIGEESFADINGNGLFDAADTLLTDLDEAFRDDDENGLLSGLEEFVDFNSDLMFSPANGMYNGTLCSDPTLCTTELLHVREEIVIVMACSFADIRANPTSVVLAAGGQAVVTVTASDCNGNALPKDTSIAMSTTNGTIVGDSTFTMPNQTAPYTFAVTIKPSKDDGIGGQLIAKATTPNGNMTTAYLTTIEDPT
jgi:hypothetical protein